MAVRIRDRLLLSGEIQVVVQELPLLVASVPHFYSLRKTLVGARKSGTLKDITHHLALQSIGHECALVGQRALAVFVASDRREVPVRATKGGDHLRGIRHKEFLPNGAGILFTDSIWVGDEPFRAGQICELLVMKATGGAQRAWRHYISHRRVLIGEPALEGHHHLPVVLHVIRDLLQYGIRSAVQRRY